MKDAAAIIEQINLMPVYERKPTARLLGDHTASGNACGYGQSPHAMWAPGEWPCCVGRRTRTRKRRRRKLQSRANYEATSANRIKPWLAQGISRRTYYYRLKASGCTSLSAVKLTNNNGHTCAITAASSQQERESAEPARAGIINPPPKPEKVEALVTDTARMFCGQTCAIVADEIGGQTCNIGPGHNGGPQMDAETIEAPAYYPPGMADYLPAPPLVPIESGPDQDLRGMPRRVDHGLTMRNRGGPILPQSGYQPMGHITPDDAKWLVGIPIFGVLVWSLSFLVLAVQPGNPRGARQRRADRHRRRVQKRALSPLAFGAMVFPSLIVITWYALPRHVRRRALDVVDFRAATNNGIGLGREVRTLARRLIRVPAFTKLPRWLQGLKRQGTP